MKHPINVGLIKTDLLGFSELHLFIGLTLVLRLTLFVSSESGK